MAAAEPKHSDVKKPKRPDVQTPTGGGSGDAPTPFAVDDANYDEPAQNVQDSERSEVQTLERLGRAIVPRKGGEVRRMTIYLSPGLAKRLKMASVEHETDMSTMAEDAIAAWLNHRGW